MMLTKRLAAEAAELPAVPPTKVDKVVTTKPPNARNDTAPAAAAVEPAIFSFEGTQNVVSGHRY